MRARPRRLVPAEMGVAVVVPPSACVASLFSVTSDSPMSPKDTPSETLSVSQSTSVSADMTEASSEGTSESDCDRPLLGLRRVGAET